MTDPFTRKKRSEIMSRIRGRDTKPEKLIRSILRTQGQRFSLYSKRLPGCPDIVLPKRRKAVFIHGCFWHGHKGCRRSSLPSTNARFWRRKINGNVARDARVRAEIRKLGWKSLVIWQCQMKKRNTLKRRLSRFLGRVEGASNGAE